MEGFESRISDGEELHRYFEEPRFECWTDDGGANSGKQADSVRKDADSFDVSAAAAAAGSDDDDENDVSEMLDLHQFEAQDDVRDSIGAQDRITIFSEEARDELASEQGMIGHTTFKASSILHEGDAEDVGKKLKESEICMMVSQNPSEEVRDGHASSGEAVIEEREEGEVEEDLAKCIRDNAEESESEEESESDASSSSEDGEDDENDVGETMEDSDPLQSSDDEVKEPSPDLSSDDEDWQASLRQNLSNQQATERKVSSDDEDDDEKPPRTRNEVASLPPVPKVDVQLQPHHVLLPIGKISSVVGLMIIVEGDVNHQALDEGSILWLPGSRVPLGFVDEVFGPVKKPFYVVRFNDVTEIPEEARESAAVAFVPDFAKVVLQNSGLYNKGYDASGLNDEELSDDEFFSDDEKEAEFKREKNRAKRAIKEDKTFQDADKRPPRNSAGASRKGNRSSGKNFAVQGGMRNFGGDGRIDSQNGRDRRHQHDGNALQQHGYPSAAAAAAPPPGPPGYWRGQPFQNFPAQQYSLSPHQGFQQQQFRAMPYPAAAPTDQFYGGFPGQTLMPTNAAFMPVPPQTWWSMVPSMMNLHHEFAAPQDELQQRFPESS